MYRYISALIIAVMMGTSVPAIAANAKAKAKPKPKEKVELPDPAEVIGNARKAVAAYDFDGAIQLIDQYNDLIDGQTPAADLAELTHVAEMGSQMMERVEKIVVIDSIVVDKQEFFKAYRISPQTGRFIGSDDSLNSPIYVTQNGLTEFFAERNDKGTLDIASARRLADGAIESPRVYPNAEGLTNSAYPFLMPDGLTLYFAASGEQSLGGYDIFITRRNSVDDEFLQPQNVGMPFNSPYDDYLMVVDESTGLGWWATDRNRLADKLTVYVFIPSELRTNLPADTPGLASLAALRSIAETQPNGYVAPVIEPLLQKAMPANYEPQFRFALPGGRIITSVAELSDPRARELMEDYVESAKDLEYDRQLLASLRLRYHDGDHSVEAEILKLESSLEKAAADLRGLANEVVRAVKQ